MALVLPLVTAGLVGGAAPARAETHLIDDRAAFVAALPHLVLEDFETAEIHGLINGCGTVVSRETPTDCFPVNGLQPGVAYLTTRYPAPGSWIAAEPRTNHGVHSKQILGAGDIILGFTQAVDTVGLDLGVEHFATTCEVTVFYVDGGAPREFPIECRDAPQAPRFVGITSDRLIKGIMIEPAGDEADPFIDNVRFGLRAPNDFTVQAIRKHRSSGSATAEVAVPCAGTASVKGSGVVSTQVRSRTAETVRLRVTPTQATQRKLNRNGRASVTVTVRFSPAGGTPATTTRKITLVKTKRQE